MGQDDEIPENNVFEGVDIRTVEPGRIAALVEKEFYSTRSVTRATRDFQARDEDVIIASNPRTGDDLLIRAVRLLNARDEEEFNQVLQMKEQSGVPWIESVFVDGDAEKIAVDQPGSRRMFKTHMTHQSLSAQRKKSPLYITFLRHPLDVRLSWYRHLREIYERCGGEGGAARFDECFTPDSFIDVPATTSHIMPHAKILTYEHTVMEWFLLGQKKPDTVLPLFYEQALVQPELVLKKIAAFLEADVTDSRIDVVVEALRNENLLPDAQEVSGNLRGRAGTVAADNAFAYTEYRSLEKMWEAWSRARESNQWLKEGPKSYEELYKLGTGAEFPFPKEYPLKPPKSGPLDNLARKCSIQ